MDNIVPGALRRLREADIMSMAGLRFAALGQEYCRIGAVHTTMRQVAQLTGIVEIPDMARLNAAPPTDAVEATEDADTRPGRYSVEVEIYSQNTWKASCTCVIPSDSVSICPHVAALLYHWLAQPASFVSPPLLATSATASPLKNEGAEQLQSEATENEIVSLSALVQPAESASVLSGPVPIGNIAEMLAQLGLSELRSMAREYGVTKTGLSKPQLVQAMSEMLKRPEAVRRVVGKLEKPQRQLLAAITLAGGSLTDDELRGLFERFSLGYLNQLQSMLASLRSKCLIVRISFNSALQQRVGLVGPILEVGWYVPAEVRAVLRVTVPLTPFDIHTAKNGPQKIQQMRPRGLMEDLLLVARALDGYQLSSDDEGSERGKGKSTSQSRSLQSSLSAPTDGVMAIPPPPGLPSQPLVESLQAVVPRSPAFLRFAIRLLRMVDILYKDDASYLSPRQGAPYLRVLPNVARLLLDPSRTEVVRDLFTRWLAQASYDELFDLQEEGLSLRCRSGPFQRPTLRSGELETENSEARQVIVALLAKAPLNQWSNFAAFARFIYRLNPTFLQKRQNLLPSPHWWVEQEEGRPLHPTQLSEWQHVEGRYLARLIEGPLHWWGLTDLALSKSGQLLAFRLTATAGLLSGEVTDHEQTPDQPRSANARSTPLRNAMSSGAGQGAYVVAERSGADIASGAGDIASGAGDVGTRFIASLSGDKPLLKVTETGELLISCSSAAWPLIELIEEFAEVAGVQDDHLRYRLTANSLREALRRGLRPVTLLQLLRQTAEQETAADESLTPLLAQLERRLANYGRTRLYTDVTLLEVADTPVMREISALTPLEEQRVRTIQPTLLILKKQGVEHIVQELKRRGQTPLLHEEEGYGAE